MKNYGLTKKEYIENFEGFSIRNIAIKNNGACAFTVVEDIDLTDETIPLSKRLSKEGDFIYRFVFFRFNQLKNRFGWIEIAGGTINRALICYLNEDEPISVDFNTSRVRVSSTASFLRLKPNASIFPTIFPCKFLTLLNKSIRDLSSHSKFGQFSF